MYMLRRRIRLFIQKQGIFALIKKIVGQALFTIYSPIYMAYLNNVKVKKNQIVFASQPDFSDNARSLYDFICTNKKFEDYSFKWLVKEPNRYKTIDERTEFICSGSKWHTKWSIKAINVIMTSEYIFFTHTSPLSGLKRKQNQIIINLWHGCGYKSMKSTSDWLGKNPCDYSLVPGSVFIETKSRFWACPKRDILPIGYPRYDEFKQINDETIQMALNIKGDADKLIIWMPTYRKTELGQFAVSKIQGFFELPILKSESEIVQLNDICKKLNVTICIKRHPLQIKYKCEELEMTNIVFIDNEYLEKNNIKLYSLLYCVDGLITDYSSVAIDYLLIDKPIAFTLDDYKEYGDTQGFVFDDPLKYMPGNHIKLIDDLEDFIWQIKQENDIYMQERHKILPEVHNPCEGYCKRICDFFFERTVKELLDKDNI